MNIRPSDILFRCGATDLLRYGRLTRTLYPEELTAVQFKETLTRASTKNVLGPDGVLYGVGANLPALDWIDANTPTVLLESARTNVVLWNRDLTNAAWTKTNVSAVKDQTGIDGVASSASRITASAGNGTCVQAITLGSSARFQTGYIKRLVGSGTIQMTTDNGSTWTAVTVTAAYTRLSIPTQTLANPTVGFRIVTNGDSVAIDFVQNENGSFATSPIAVTTVAVARAADVLTFPYSSEPRAVAIHLKFYEAGAALAAGSNFPTLLQIGQYGAAPNWRQIIYYAGGAGHYTIGNGNSAGQVTKSMAADPSSGQLVELLPVIAADGSVKMYQSIAGAADTATTISTAQAMPSGFGTTQVIQFGDANYNETCFRLVAAKVILASPSAISDVRSLP